MATTTAKRTMAVGLLAALLTACNVTEQGQLPPNVRDPASVQTPAGAQAYYRNTVELLEQHFSSFVAVLALFTDELMALPTPSGVYGGFILIDSRSGGSDRDLLLYRMLHTMRGQSQDGRGFLAAYGGDSFPPALRGHLYAVEGIADVLLADMYCSGIPLSTVDFNGDYTVSAGVATDEVYARAAGLFDSALALTVDSARLRHFAAIGRARALLASDRDSLARAAATVAEVPTDYAYMVTRARAATGSGDILLGSLSSYLTQPGMPTVGDREGGIGLDFRTSNDPRTPTVRRPSTDFYGDTMYVLTRYIGRTVDTFVIANGIEARLIEAEAALAAGGDWLGRLNALRTDGTFDAMPTADPNDDPAANDTLWHAGTGGIPGLAPLEDPGNASLRVDLLFRERAFWLYQTAHRQGDLRRLIRQYGRSPATVYPMTGYPGGAGLYSPNVNVAVPDLERMNNPKYDGCFHRNA